MLRRRVQSLGRVTLRSASLPCAHRVSLLGGKRLLAFHPGNRPRPLPPETAVVDDQTRASELHQIYGKGLWLQYEGSYPGLLQAYKTISSRVGIKGFRQSKLRGGRDVAIAPNNEDILELWQEARDEKEDRSDRLNRLHIEVDRMGACVSVKDFPATLSLKRLMQHPDIPTDVGGALIPYHTVRAMRAADEWEKKGVTVQALDGAQLHPRFGVFPPTRQDYIGLLAQHLPSVITSLPAPVIAEDLGSGSGVLSFLLAKHGAAAVRGYDILQAAVDSATADAELLKLSSKVSFHLVDLVEDLPAALASTPAPNLMVCNPPWLPDDATSALDAAIYDPECLMLRSSLLYARRRLRPDGKLLLLYSDLGMHLGLFDEKFIATSIAQVGFTIAEKHRLPANAELADGVPEEDKDQSDDLFSKIRKRERVALYVLTRKPSSETPQKKLSAERKKKTM